MPTGCWDTEQGIQNFTERGEIKNEVSGQRMRKLFREEEKDRGRGGPSSGLGKSSYLSSLFSVHPFLMKRLFWAPEDGKQEYGKRLELKKNEAQKEIGELDLENKGRLDNNLLRRKLY